MTLISVLLVDDNPTFLRIVTRYLQEHDDISIVGTANDGYEALHQAKLLHPQVVVLDLAMPGMNGLETIPQLRSFLPKTRIIALTLLDTNGYRQAALDVGADSFVPKTGLNEKLLPAIRRFSDSPSQLEDTPFEVVGEPYDYGLAGSTYVTMTPQAAPGD